MITRPLDLASKLRPAPPSLDAFFFVNAALLVFFFSLFGSRFVLAPALGFDFQLPAVTGANADARPTTHHITVLNARQIFAGDGLRNREELRTWFVAQSAQWAKDHAKMTTAVPKPTLLVIASSQVEMAVIAGIAGAADAAGFEVRVASTEPGAVAPKLLAPP